MGKFKRHFWFILTAVAAVGLDRFAKIWVQTNMTLFESREMIGDFFRISFVKNPGIAFGMFASSEHSWLKILLMVLAFAAIGFVIYIYAISKKTKLDQASLGFIFGGALGNIFDRIVSGKVVDFLDFGIGSYRFYTFNLADSAIIFGLILLLVQVLLEEKRAKEASETPPIP